MQIFNVHIFGTDIEWFKNLSCAAKKQWIKDNTNQKDDGLIKEFLNSKQTGSTPCCEGCKGHKPAQDGNISAGVPKTAVNTDKKHTAKSSRGANAKGGTNPDTA